MMSTSSGVLLFQKDIGFLAGEGNYAQRPEYLLPSVTKYDFRLQ